MWFQLILCVHVLSAFVFFAAHGVSITVGLWISTVRDPVRLHAALDLSGHVRTTSNLSLGILLLSGLAAGFLGDSWGSAWIWISLLLFAFFTVLMWTRIGPAFRLLRSLIGPVGTQGETLSAVDPAMYPRVDAIIRRLRLPAVAWAGTAWLIVMVYLMVARPF